MAAHIQEPLFRLSEDVTNEDIPIMAAIGYKAFLDDAHTNLKKYFLPEISGADDSGIRQWLSASDRCHVIKAVSNTTNEIMGFICWAHRGYVSRPPRPEATAGRFTEASADAKHKTRIQIMEDMEDQHFVDFMTEIMPAGTKCWYVGGLNVATKYQRMGVAKALLSWGTARVERDGVFAWVHSSDSAWRAYAACGFQIVRVLRTDLDVYAEGDAVGKGPGEDGKWGIYTVRYMVYNPDRIGKGGWKVITDVESSPLS